MELAEVHHQAVHLSINPSAGVLHGWTELQASVSHSASSLGLHALGLEISSVCVNGQPVPWQLRPAPGPGLTKDTPSAKDVSEQAYHDYISAIKYERAPQLEVHLPEHLMAEVRTLQSSQGPLALGPGAPQEGARDGYVPKQASDQQGGDAAGVRDQGQVAAPHAAGMESDQAPGQQQQLQAGRSSSLHPATPPAKKPSGVGGAEGKGSATPGSTKKSVPAVESASARTSVSVHIAFSRRLLAHSDTGAVMLVGGEGEAGAGQHCLASSLAGLLSGGLGGPKPAELPPAVCSGGGEGDGAGGPALQLDGGLFGQGHEKKAGSVLANGGSSGVSQPGLPGHGTEDKEGVGPEGEQLYFVSDPQLRRARALFPCVDDAGRLAEYELWLSVPPDYVAVCGGELRGNMLTLAKEDSEVPKARTFHFAPGYPVTAAHMVISAGPMDVQPGYQPAPPPPEGTRFTMNGGGGAEFGSAMRSVLNEVAKEGSAAGAGPATMHTKMYASAASNVPAPPPACAFTLFAPPALADLAAYTARPLYLIQREMEAHLDCPLPCSQLHVVFMPPAAMQALTCGPQQAVSVGANIILASTEILVGPESVEGVMESCLALAGAMARQWFGVLMQPFGAEDAWVLEGLAAYLEDVFGRAAMGQNDVAWRRHKEREAVAMADDGAMPPLYAHHASAGGKDSGQGGGLGGKAGVDQGATGAEDYGCTFGTEMLEPGPLRRWKAAAVVRMLEAKTGVDEFKRMLRTTVRKAMQSVGLTGTQEEGLHAEEKDEPASLQNPRLISTQAFLRLVKQYAGRKGLDAFAERWIYGRGCPRFTLGMKYSKHHNSLLFGMKQSGSAASQRSARAALAVGKVSKQGVDESLGHVKIHVQESHATSEAMIRVSPQDSYVFHEHYLACRPGMKKPGRKPKAETLAKAAREAEEANERLDADEQAGKHPVKFVRIDARCEWLCLSNVKQAENLWVNQLLHSKDVVAQAEAVTGLARLASNFDRPTQGVVSTLEACLKDRSIFSRVRAEVALVMGATADDTSDYAALPVLCKFFDDATRDPRTRQLRPNAFGDLSEYIVLRSLPRALARLRDGNFKSPPEVLDLLLGFLDHSDNTGNPYSDAHFTARFIEALGHLRLATPLQLADVLRLLDRHLALEDMLPSPNHVVGRACLTSMAQLAASLGGWAERNRKAHEGARHTLGTYASPNVPLPLRQTAAQSLVLLESALALVDDKVKAVVSCTLELLQAPGWGASGLTSLMVGALEILGQLPPKEVPDNAEGEEAFVFDGIPAQAALQLYNLMHTTTDARLRQCAFMLLMRATGEDPTLYREREEEEEEMEEVEVKEPEPSKPTQTTGTRTVDPRSQMIMGLGFRPGELEQFQEEQEREAAAKAGKAAPSQAQAEAAAAKEKVKLGSVAAMLRKRKHQRPGSPSLTGVSGHQTSTWGGGGSISRPAPTESTQLDSMEQQQEVEQPVQDSAATKAEQQQSAAAAAVAEAHAKPATPVRGVIAAEPMEVEKGIVNMETETAAAPVGAGKPKAEVRKEAAAGDTRKPRASAAAAHKPWAAHHKPLVAARSARSASPPSAATAGTTAAAPYAPAAAHSTGAAAAAAAASHTGAPAATHTAGALLAHPTTAHKPAPHTTPAQTSGAHTTAAAHITGAPAPKGIARRHVPRHPSPLAPHPARTETQPMKRAYPSNPSLSPPPSTAAAVAAPSRGLSLRNGVPPHTGSLQQEHGGPSAPPLQKAAPPQQQHHQQKKPAPPHQQQDAARGGLPASMDAPACRPQGMPQPLPAGRPQGMPQHAPSSLPASRHAPAPASQSGPVVPKKSGAIKLKFGSKRAPEAGAGGAPGSQASLPTPSHAPSAPLHTQPRPTLPQQPSTARAIPTLQQPPSQHTAIPTTSRAIPTLHQPPYHLAAPAASSAVPTQPRAIPTLHQPRDPYTQVQPRPSHAAAPAATAAPAAPTYQQQHLQHAQQQQQQQHLRYAAPAAATYQQQLKHPRQAPPHEAQVKAEEAEQPAPKKPKIKLKMKGHGESQSQQPEPAAPAPAPAQAPGGTKIKFRFGKGGG